jgi:hypothetical protein
MDGSPVVLANTGNNYTGDTIIGTNRPGDYSSGTAQFKVDGLAAGSPVPLDWWYGAPGRQHLLREVSSRSGVSVESRSGRQDAALYGRQGACRCKAVVTRRARSNAPGNQPIDRRHNECQYYGENRPL